MESENEIYNQGYEDGFQDALKTNKFEKIIHETPDYRLHIDKPGSFQKEIIHFESREKMDIYINGEAKFCRPQQMALWKAVSKKDREKAKENLISARYDFFKKITKGVFGNEAG